MLHKEYLSDKPICKVTFSLSKAAVAGTNIVKVVGQFNDWSWESGALMEEKGDMLEAVLELPTGNQYEFRYLADNFRWANDAAADAYVGTPYGVENCVVILEAKESEAPAPKTTKKTAPKKATPKKKKTTKSSKDNLKKIEGIGPKIEKLLNAREITTFDALAKAKIELLKEILVEAGPRFKMHDPTTWTEQAGLAAADKWDELATLQDELKGGKRTK